MQKKVPKPYLMLGGQTILERTISQFLPLQGLAQIWVPTSEHYVERAQQILDTLLPDEIIGRVIVGGAERQLSIYKALREVGQVELVLVHDAVRPFVKLKHIKDCCEAALDEGAATLGIPAQDTIKEVDEKSFVQRTPTRSKMRQVQTPQVFSRELLVEAYQRAEKDNFRGTDDASLVEHMGHPVKMVASDRMNLKLTYPLDLELAELIINKNKE